MSFLLSLYEQLAADATVTANVSTRIYRGSAPQSATMPYLVMHEISKRHAHHLRGAAGIVEGSIQIDVIDDDPDDCQTIAETIRDTIDGLHGTMGTSNTTDVRRCFLSRESDDNFSPQDGGDIPIYRRILEFDIAHAESLPSLS